MVIPKKIEKYIPFKIVKIHCDRSDQLKSLAKLYSSGILKKGNLQTHGFIHSSAGFDRSARSCTALPHFRGKVS